ncbi:hypothetical protein BN134_3301 [Cronobacter dublinensis 1210]|uniref:Uncharacterized protein n=1 Tax=Cronobacter dublinensis 1210 TaxID=1208656 RepID=A0ABM9QAG5_9ENTR|nr:hypothetical protein BN134_3301 [Cronobacter dublinensis 1210]
MKFLFDVKKFAWRKARKANEKVKKLKAVTKTSPARKHLKTIFRDANYQS